VKATNETPIGSVAGLVTDALGVDVGLCYKEKDDLINLSIRSKRGLAFHLGEITRRVAAKNGGFGGGHKRASGASIPNQNLKGFIRDLEDELRG
jgi:single-stranded DNA-specific DHH superfamily exonuclease